MIKSDEIRKELERDLKQFSITDEEIDAILEQCVKNINNKWDVQDGMEN